MKIFRALCVVLTGAIAASAAAAAAAQAVVPPAPPACTPAIRSAVTWGVAASAYQIEGAWDEGGKGPSIWDVYEPAKGSGCVAIDHYHRWREDVSMMSSLGVQSYRLSISWPRVVPSGFAGSPINQQGLDFYRGLLSGLLAAGITPAVTIYHWDLPLPLEERAGGFLAKGTEFQDAFVYFADVLFRELGPLVKVWITFNEPISICELGYGAGIMAPGKKGGLAGQFACGHNLLLAHAKAAALYRGKYAAAQGGRLGVALDGRWGIPYSNHPADVEAVRLYMDYQGAWMSDPLIFGDWPASMRARLASDVLPRFSEAESVMLEGSVDFLGVNFYSAWYIKAARRGEPPYVVKWKGPNLKWVGRRGASPWLFWTPSGLRECLEWLAARYSGARGAGGAGARLELMVTENGLSLPRERLRGPPKVLRDDERVSFYSEYIGELCTAIAGAAPAAASAGTTAPATAGGAAAGGVNVTAYYAWTMWDNTEWRKTFTERFGLVHVDLKNNLTRTPKASALWMSERFWARGARRPE